MVAHNFTVNIYNLAIFYSWNYLLYALAHVFNWNGRDAKICKSKKKNYIKEQRVDGKRFNAGKPKLALIPAEAELAEARVWTMGAEKYGEDFNWNRGGPALSYTQILSSMARHMNALKSGQDIDPESGEHHAAHIRCNAAMLIQFWVDGRLEQDDRLQSELRDLMGANND